MCTSSRLLVSFTIYDSKEEYGCISFNKQSELLKEMYGKMYDVMPDFTGKVIQSSILTD